jgi:hypothetical protein
VIVSGGRFTTRTDPDDEPDETDASCCVAWAFAAAICAVRAFNALR